MSFVESDGAKRDDVWYIDSGCSNHMCGDLSLFCELQDDFQTVVRLGNHTKMNVVGKGSVRLFLDGISHLVTDVFYVPELRNHLLSVGQLQEKGLSVLMGSNQCRIYHPEKCCEMCAGTMWTELIAGEVAMTAAALGDQ